MTRKIICVACPLGCEVLVELNEAGELQQISGNNCKRGVSYAQAECTHPTRPFTSTVRVEGGNLPLVSVKSAEPIPKAMMLACAEATKRIVAKAPVAMGDVVLANAAGTGIDLLATNRVDV